MTTETIKKFPSFILGKCRCGCGTDIPIRNAKGELRKYVYRHNLKGPHHTQWKGGRVQDKIQKYIKVYAPDHPFKDCHGKVPEHRLVMEKHIGRYLTPEEQVHHINKIRDDNRIENLQLMSNNTEHKKEHRKDMSNRSCSICGSNKTSIRSSGRPSWKGNEKDGWKCDLCYKREWSNKNKVKVIGYAKKYEDKNREKVLKRKMDYYYKNREKNKERVAQYNKEYRQKNRERLLEKDRERYRNKTKSNQL